MNNTQTKFNPFSQNLVIVKDYFKKPLVLVLAIIYSLSIGVSIVSGFMIGPVMSDMYQKMFSLAGVYEEMTDADTQIMNMFLSEGTLTTFIVSAMLPALILTGLYALAYFLIYFKSKNPNPDSTPKAGFTILYVMSILSLIALSFSTLIIVLCALGMILAAIGISQDLYITGSESTMIIVVFSIIALIFVGIGALMLTYGISNFNYIKNVRNSLSSVNLSAKGAGAYGVISLIYGIFSLLSLLPTIFMAPFLDILAHNVPAEFPIEVFASMGDIYLISGLMSLVSVSVIIIDAIIALGYKKYINSITNNFSSPDVFSQPPVQQAPAYAETGFQPVAYNTTYQSEKTCPNCGTVAKSNDVFCNSCGYKL